jgi:hypothetical protein
VNRRCCSPSVFGEFVIDLSLKVGVFGSPERDVIDSGAPPE